VAWLAASAMPGRRGKTLAEVSCCWVPSAFAPSSDLSCLAHNGVFKNWRGKGGGISGLFKAARFDGD